MPLLDINIHTGNLNIIISITVKVAPSLIHKYVFYCYIKNSHYPAVQRKSRLVKNCADIFY